MIVYIRTCVYIHWRPEEDASVFINHLTNQFGGDKSRTELGDYQLARLAGGKPRGLSVSTSPVLGLIASSYHHVQPFKCVLEMELRSLCLCGIYFDN